MKKQWLISKCYLFSSFVVKLMKQNLQNPNHNYHHHLLWDNSFPKNNTKSEPRGLESKQNKQKHKRHRNFFICHILSKTNTFKNQIFCLTLNHGLFFFSRDLSEFTKTRKVIFITSPSFDRIGERLFCSAQENLLIKMS